MNLAVRREGESKTQEPKHMGWYVVAFLDLLGQQNLLSKITALPNIENQAEVTDFKQKVAEFYKPLYGLETFFKTGIKSFKEGQQNEKGFSPSGVEILQQLRSTPIFYRHFSDSLIVHIPLSDNLGKFQCHAIYGVLTAAALTVLSCLVHSWAIRGGIELGLAMDIGEGEIYGPALARAYRMESRVAQYPRIVIGEELIRYLRKIAEQEAKTVDERAHAYLANKSLGLLEVDEDGCTFLDWLGSDIISSLGNPKKLVNSAYNFIIRESVTHKKARNSKLAFRYALLRKYIESRLPNLGVDLQGD